MKEFVICEELVKKIQKALLSYRDHIDTDCARSGCMCDLYGCRCSLYASEVLHDFETSLRITECIPDDFKQHSNPEELKDRVKKGK